MDLLELKFHAQIFLLQGHLIHASLRTCLLNTTAKRNAEFVICYRLIKWLIVYRKDLKDVCLFSLAPNSYEQ